MNNADLPLSFVMALAQNESAAKQFNNLSEAQKADIINRSHNVHSKQEMQNLVNNLFDDSLSI